MVKKTLREQASDPNTPVEVLRKLASHRFGPIRYLVAANPSTPASDLRNLASDFDGKVVLGVLRRPDITEDLMRVCLCNSAFSENWKAHQFYFIPNQQMLGDLFVSIDNWHYWSAASRHPLTPPEYLERLYREHYYTWVLENPNCPIGLLEEVVGSLPDMDKDTFTNKVGYLLNNPNCPTWLKSASALEKGAL